MPVSKRNFFCLSKASRRLGSSRESSHALLCCACYLETSTRRRGRVFFPDKRNRTYVFHVLHMERLWRRMGISPSCIGTALYNATGARWQRVFRQTDRGGWRHRFLVLITHLFDGYSNNWFFFYRMYRTNIFDFDARHSCFSTKFVGLLQRFSTRWIHCNRWNSHNSVTTRGRVFDF